MASPWPSGQELVDYVGIYQMYVLICREVHWNMDIYHGIGIIINKIYWYDLYIIHESYICMKSIKEISNDQKIKKKFFKRNMSRIKYNKHDTYTVSLKSGTGH